MKRGIILGLFCTLALLLLINSVSAVQFWKYDGKRLDNNFTSYKWGVVTYESFENPNIAPDISPSFWDITIFPLFQIFTFQTLVELYPDYNSDTIESGKPLEVLIKYNVYPDYWNSVNTNNTISSCSFTLRYSNNDMNTSTIIYQANYSDSDLTNGKYFVRLQRGDTIYIDEQCSFESASSRVIEIPADFTIVAPTWNCQECQFYEWQKDQVRLTKATTLADYSNRILEYMKQIILIFYEFFIYGWWFLLIILLLMVVSLIFIGIYWIYNFLVKHTR